MARASTARCVVVPGVRLRVYAVRIVVVVVVVVVVVIIVEVAVVCRVCCHLGGWFWYGGCC